MLDLRSNVLDAEPLQAWVERQKMRLSQEGVDWIQYCRNNDITEWARKRLRKGGLISYSFADIFLAPAGWMPEDLYGWPE